MLTEILAMLYSVSLSNITQAKDVADTKEKTKTAITLAGMIIKDNQARQVLQSLLDGPDGDRFAKGFISATPFGVCAVRTHDLGQQKGGQSDAITETKS